MGSARARGANLEFPVSPPPCFSSIPLMRVLARTPELGAHDACLRVARFSAARAGVRDGTAHRDPRLRAAVPALDLVELNPVRGAADTACADARVGRDARPAGGEEQQAQENRESAHALCARPARARSRIRPRMALTSPAAIDPPVGPLPSEPKAAYAGIRVVLCRPVPGMNRQARSARCPAWHTRC